MLGEGGVDEDENGINGWGDEGEVSTDSNKHGG
jgi:hypothetical protein